MACSFFYNKTLIKPFLCVLRKINLVQDDFLKNIFFMYFQRAELKQKQEDTLRAKC